MSARHLTGLVLKNVAKLYYFMIQLIIKINWLFGTHSGDFSVSYYDTIELFFREFNVFLREPVIDRCLFIKLNTLFRQLLTEAIIRAQKKATLEGLSELLPEFQAKIMEYAFDPREKFKLEETEKCVLKIFQFERDDQKHYIPSPKWREQCAAAMVNFMRTHLLQAHSPYRELMRSVAWLYRCEHYSVMVGVPEFVTKYAVHTDLGEMLLRAPSPYFIPHLSGEMFSSFHLNKDYFSAFPVSGGAGAGAGGFT